MMESITLGQISIGVAFLVALITGVSFLIKRLKEWILALLKEQFDGITSEVKGLYKRLDAVDMESTKNFLVSYLSDIERGHELDEIEKERFFEQYEHYLHVGGNSYIKHKVDKLKGEGKL